jgi:hypothetical protein
MTKTTRKGNIHFFVVCFQQTPEKNSCRFLFSCENCRSSSYLRSFFLFPEDFLLCKHETYNYTSYNFLVHLFIFSLACLAFFISVVHQEEYHRELIQTSPIDVYKRLRDKAILNHSASPSTYFCY